MKLSRHTLLLAGFAAQLSGTVFSTLTSLYIVNVLEKSPTEFANETFAWRYFGITVGVAVLGPLGSVIGAGITLRLALIATMAVELIMCYIGYDGFRLCVAVGSATTSLAMVQVNALIQTLTRHDNRYQSQLNSEYRLLAAIGAVLFPVFTTNVVVLLIPNGYWVSFLLAGLICASGSLFLDTAFDTLVKETAEDAGGDDGRDDKTNKHDKSTARESKLSLYTFIKPYATIFRNQNAVATMAQIMMLSLPSHVVGTFLSSRYRDVGASQEFQGISLSIAAAGTIPAIFAARWLLRLLGPGPTYTLLAGLNGVFIMSMGLISDPVSLLGLNLASTMLSKAGPVSHSVWISRTVEPLLLPAMFAVEKVVGCFLRFLASRLLGYMATVMALADIFIVFGVIGVVIAFSEGVWLARMQSQKHRKAS
eukprot:TRINITY_DN9867_c0_g2_i1.p1 TRINITY_DN9867_c0_g2~~TRINITY_DN9867_c0_g2_i1.p1  ORF type:complete len:422 (+),score=71.69 TRINITY_DN9867_c0_g2_i1:215-1480(+)